MNTFYREYLDADIDRFGTNCEKWDKLEEHFGRGDLVAAWVADMDFRTVPAVIDALAARVQHGIFGYTENGAVDKAAEVGWLKRRHGAEVSAEWILYSPGVVDSLFFCVRALTAPGDPILIQTPVYGPFYASVNKFGRTLVESPLLETEAGWRMDFDDMERKFQQGVKMMILCSPHNPISRVWTRDELTRLMALANRYGVRVISDEIHADFTFDGHRQVRILGVEGGNGAVMLTSATKSFNLAGLRQSSCIVPDEKLREAIAAEIDRAHATSPNIFGAIAQTAAYTHGDEWMDAVVEYVRENRDRVVDYLKENLPEIRVRPQEGTYLMWLDLRALDGTHEELRDLLINRAHVALNSGLDFGTAGEKHFRLNLATPRRNIERLLSNINSAIRSR